MTDLLNEREHRGQPGASGVRSDIERLLNQLNDHYVAYDREWRYTFVNRAAAELLGLPAEQLIGRRIWDLFPDAVGNDYYLAVHRAMDEQRDLVMEFFYAPFNRWFENRIYASPDGVAVLGTDITERKRHEQHTVLLAQVSEELAHASGSEALMALAAERIGRYFAASHCALAEFDIAANRALVSYDWRANAADRSFSGQYDLSAFVTDTFRQALAAGLPVAVDDVVSDPISAQSLASYRELGIRSFLNAPHLSNGELKAALVLYHHGPHQWRADEVELLRELVARVWVYLERARVAERLRALQEVTARLAAAQTLAEVRRVALHEVTRALGAARGSLYRVAGQELLLDDHERPELVTVGDQRHPRALPLEASHPAAEAARGGEPLFFTGGEPAEGYPDLAPATAKDGAETCAYLPLKRGHEVFGVLGLECAAPCFWDAASRAFAQSLAERTAVSYERARLFDGERHARERAERLQAVTAALSGATTPAEVYEAVLSQGLMGAEESSRALRARTGTLYILAGDTLALGGWRQAHPALMGHYDSIPLEAPIPAAEAARAGTPIWLRSRAEFLRRYPHLEAQILLLDSEAAASLPVAFEGRTLGVLNLTFAEPLPFAADDQAFLLTLAAQTGQALERSRLFDAERRARYAAEAISRRLTSLQTVTANLAMALTPEEIIRTVVQDGLAAAEADGSVLALLTPGGDAFEIVAATGYGPEALGQWRHFPRVPGLPTADVVESGRPLFFSTREAAAAQYPALMAAAQGSHQSWALLPLQGKHQSVGTLSINFEQPRAFPPEEQAYLLTLARHCAQALERAQLLADLQRSEARFRRVVESTAQIIWTVRPNGEFAGRQLSWEQFTGQRPDEYAAAGGFQAVHPDDRAAVSAVWANALADGKLFEAEYRLRRHDGVYRHVRARSAPVLGPDGVIVEWVGVAEDRTERRQRELNTAFIDEVSQHLTRLTDEHEIIQVASERVVAYLGVQRCQFTEYDAASNTASVVYDSTQDGQRSLRGSSFRLSDLVADEVVALLSHGGQLAIYDTLRDPATAAAAERFAQLGVGALVTTPYISNGRWEAALTVHAAAPRTWRNDELALLRELAERVWARVERSRAEVALREREAQLAAFLEHSPGSLFIKDAASRYVAVNHAFLASTGRTAEEVIGKADRDLFPPELAELFSRQDQQVLASGKTCSFEDTFIYNGQEYTFLSQKFPLPGGSIGTVGTDITERRRTEEQLTTANYRFRLAEEAAKGFNYEWNLETGFVTRSESVERVLGYRHEEIGTSWQAWVDLLHPADRAVSSTADTIALVQQHPESIVSSEYRVRHRDGHYLWVMDRAMIIRDEHGGAWRLIGQTVDITERKSFEAEREQLYAQERAARAEAEEASRLKDEFLATVSHELRTPLTAFLGYAQLLQSRRRDEAYVARTAEKMVRSAKAQAQLIEDLLDISRIVSGKLRLETELLDLREVVRAALDTVRPAAEAKGLGVRLGLGATPVLLVGDANRLQQVVWNLLTNAVKFTPHGGGITVELERDGHDVRLSVRDTGVGIPADFLPYVFDRFRQADGSTQRMHGGLGLGLAIVRHLVELHGGSVAASSPGEGHGSAFFVRLPLTPEGTPVSGGLAAAAPDDGGCPPELAGLRVLIVDDQPDILDLLHDVLAPCGAIVQLCGTAQAALEAVRAWRPSILISDIAMPGEDGYWLIEQVRALGPEQGGALPAIALTAYVRLEDRLRVLAAGFEQYVPKPVEPAELRAVVARLARA